MYVWQIVVPLFIYSIKIEQWTIMSCSRGTCRKRLTSTSWQHASLYIDRHYPMRMYFAHVSAWGGTAYRSRTLPIVLLKCSLQLHKYNLARTKPSCPIDYQQKYRCSAKSNVNATPPSKNGNMMSRAGTIQSLAVHYRYRRQPIRIGTVIMLYRYRWWWQPHKQRLFRNQNYSLYTWLSYTIGQKT